MTDVLDVPQPERCSFCDYLAGVRPFSVVDRSALTAILVTREQRGVENVLVIPVAHRPTLLDLEPDEASAVMATVIAAAVAITSAFKPRGIAVWQNNGVPANQTIPHVHFHIAGTLPDGGQSSVTYLSFRVSRLTRWQMRFDHSCISAEAASTVAAAALRANKFTGRGAASLAR